MNSIISHFPNAKFISLNIVKFKKIEKWWAMKRSDTIKHGKPLIWHLLELPIYQVSLMVFLLFYSNTCIQHMEIDSKFAIVIIFITQIDNQVCERYNPYPLPHLRCWYSKLPLMKLFQFPTVDLLANLPYSTLKSPPSSLNPYENR